jgi:tRNA(Ile)-lysidine synthase
MALLHGLLDFREKSPFPLFVLHLNHGLRGAESDGDEEFVRQHAAALGIPFRSRRIFLPGILRERKGSLEELAREERYRFFDEAAAAEGLSRIALGHHGDDQAETVLMHFLRGSGLRGLRGMEPVRDGRYIRPLIDVSREEILDFLDRRGIPYRTDGTNRELQPLRNRIRHHLVPLLEEGYNANIRETLRRVAPVLREENDFLETMARRAADRWRGPGEEAFVSLREFDELHPALQRRALKELLEGLVGRERRVLLAHVEAVLGLIRGDRPSGRLHLPLGVAAEREYDQVRIIRTGISGRRRDASTEAGGERPFRRPVTIPGVCSIPEAGRTIRLDPVPAGEPLSSSGTVVFFDRDKAVPPLLIRSVERGDRIQPLGCSGSRRVMDLLMDGKVPRRDRGKIPLLVDGLGVLWVAGFRLSERVRVTERTERAVRAEMI